MTLTEFRARTAEAFGDLRADHLVRSHHLATFGGRTASEAIDAGEPVKQVWLALCAEFEVPDALR
ncbi:DUF3046 domain-containing protein [Dietzia sp. UBA5065]|jgi:hypothetical protein|uniref:DUF3046 domain-containing protein n=1 Tax=Dietzia sp. UBA5065 TaxID=1946422 RepID=UPI0025C38D00|nr:DUF3046 domain-containing protein [Dietzia sp. UBA5065]HMT48848.1 DUF3046 domain-containing protein [Dietzia sp.]